MSQSRTLQRKQPRRETKNVKPGTPFQHLRKVKDWPNDPHDRADFLHFTKGKKVHPR